MVYSLTACRKARHWCLEETAPASVSGDVVVVELSGGNKRSL